MHLLDVLGDSRLVGGALDERRLDLGSLDALLDVVDEDLGDLVRVARDEERRQVVVGVDAGAGDDSEAGCLRDSAHEAHVAAEEHRAWVGDRVDPELDRGASDLDRDLLVASRRDRVRRLLLGGPDMRELLVDRFVACAQVLVDQRRAELAHLDRPGDGLDRRHAATICRCRTPAATAWRPPGR